MRNSAEGGGSSHLLLFARLIALLLLFVNFRPAVALTLDVWDYPRWSRGPGETDRFYWMREQTEEFRSFQPGIKIRFTPLTWDRGGDKILLGLVSGSGPDVFTGVLSERLVETNKLADIGGYLSEGFREKIHPGALEAFQREGELLGVPWYITGNLLFVRKDIVQSCGMKVPDRWHDWEEFSDWIETLRLRLPDDRYPLGFLVQRGDKSAYPLLFKSDEDLKRGRLIGSLLSAIAAGRMDLLRNWKKGRLLHPETGGWTAKTLWQAFTERGDVVVAPFGFWAVGAMKKRNVPFTTVPFPAIEGTEAYTILGTSGFMIGRSNELSERAATRLVEFLLREENYQAMMDNGIIPAVETLPPSISIDPDISHALSIFRDGVVPEESKTFPAQESRVILYLQKVLADLDSPMPSPPSAWENEKQEEKEFLKVRTGRIVIGVSLTIVLFAFLYCLSKTGIDRGFALLLIPAVVFAVIFFFLPQTGSILLAFFKSRLTGGGFELEYAGTKNFVDLRQDGTILVALKNTLLYTLLIVPIHTLLAFIIAWLIHPLNRTLSTVFKSAFYLPYITSMVVYALIWNWIYDFNYGLLNFILEWGGGERVGWLSDPELAFGSVLAMCLFISPGASILVYLSHFATLPGEIFELARMEGASSARTLYSIVWPMSKPITQFLVLMGIISSFQVFIPVYILTRGGPAKSSTVLIYELYESGFVDLNLGRAAAIGCVVLIMVLLAYPLVNRFFRVDWKV